MKIDFKKCMITVAMSLAITGAIASKVVNLPCANENEYSWTRTGGEPLPEEQNSFVGTKADAQNHLVAVVSTTSALLEHQPVLVYCRK